MYIGARHKGIDAVVQQSRYKVPAPPTGNYGSSQNPFEYQMDQGVDPSIWFQEDAVAYWDDYLCPEHPGVPQYPNGYPVDLDRKIASGQTGLGAYTSEGYMWLHDYYLYRKAKENPGMMVGDPIISAFVANKGNLPLGQLYEVEKSISELYQIPEQQLLQLDSVAALIHAKIVAVTVIDSILLDTTLSESARQQWVNLRKGHIVSFDLLQGYYDLVSTPVEQAFLSELATIVLENNSISSTKTWELNQKFVNRILLERIIPQATVSTGDLNQLHSIAASCPEFGGWAVYDAQSYYAWLTDSIVPKASCMPIQARSGNKPSAQALGINISPNPASDYLNVSCEYLAPNTRFRLIDVVGKIYLDLPITENIEAVDVRACPPGVYFAQVSNEGRLIATLKVIITR